MKTSSQYSLRGEQLEFFEKNGYLGPLKLIAPEEMGLILKEIEREINAIKLIPWKNIKGRNRHFDILMLWKIFNRSEIVELARSLLGEYPILWRSQIFDVDSSQKALQWHCDSYRTLLSPCDKDNFSIQLALTEAFSDNCVAIIPGSHKLNHDLIRKTHKLRLLETSLDGEYGTPTYASNFLTKPQKVIYMTLKAGEFFLFDNKTLHRTHFEKGAMGRKAIALRLAKKSVLLYPKAFEGSVEKYKKAVSLDGKGISDE